LALYCIIVISTLGVSFLFPEQGSRLTALAVPLPNGGWSFLRRIAPGSRPLSLNHKNQTSNVVYDCYV
jgi:hypothetical protein